MTPLHQHIKLIALTVVLTTAILLVACDDKTEDSNQTEPLLSTLTDDKIAQLQREAQAGDPDAQYDLAYLYENGLGVPMDETRALELYQQAADQGHPAAQANLDAINNSK